jgi:hypothetical protein
MSNTGTTPYEAALASVKAKGGKVTKVAPGTRRVKKDTPMPASTKKALDAKVKSQVKARNAKKPHGPVGRLTTTWASAKRKDVKIGDTVKTQDGVVLTVIGRWTRHAKTGLVPCISGTIVSLPAGATVSAGGKGRGKGDNLNVAAATVTHVGSK